MANVEIEAKLAAAIDVEKLEGAWGWPSSEMAMIARRRWESFSCRTKTRSPAEEDRVFDLAKGLKAHFDKANYDPFADYLHLATVLANVFAEFSD